MRTTDFADYEEARMCLAHAEGNLLEAEIFYAYERAQAEDRALKGRSLKDIGPNEKAQQTALLNLLEQDPHWMAIEAEIAEMRAKVLQYRAIVDIYRYNQKDRELER